MAEPIFGVVMFQKNLLTPALAAAMLAFTVGCSANAEDFSKQEIETIVKEYILENPEIISDAIMILQQRAEAAQAEQQANALSSMQRLLTDNPLDPVGGNPEGTVTLVEFFDYNCGYCKRAGPTLKALIEANPNLKVVYKEWPILSEGSAEAAKIALAVNLTTPERYEEFHSALLNAGSIRSANDVWRVVDRLNLDKGEIESQLTNPDIERHLQQAAQLAQSLNITGTPAFVVGDTILRGAYPQEDIQRAIDQAS